MTDQLKSAALAYQNEPFLNSPDGRILRIWRNTAGPSPAFAASRSGHGRLFRSARFQSMEDAKTISPPSAKATPRPTTTPPT
jgi:hypothetical protein